MLCLVPNKKRNTIHFIFKDSFTERRLFEICFNLDESLNIAEGIIDEVENLKKDDTNMDKKINKIMSKEKAAVKETKQLLKMDKKQDKKMAKCDMEMKKKKGK